MAFSCGFYNSLNGDRKYNVRQVSELFDGIIRDGVYMSIGDKLTVKQGTGMQITVGTGRAWFNHTWSLIDADLPLTVEQSDLVLDRIDAVVLEIDESSEVRDNAIKMVKGTAASSPSKPEMTNTEFIHQYPLAYITVKKGVTSITTADIEINVGKDDCPYVTSVLEAASIEELYAQWEAQFSNWEDGQKNQFEAWFAEIKGQLSEDAAGNLQVQIDDKGIQVYTHSKSGTVHEFTGRGPNGRALMTANVEDGDTFTVNGSPVTAYMGTEDAVSSMVGNEWNGKWITFVFEGETLNFKGGAGKVVNVKAISSVDELPDDAKEGDVILVTDSPVSSVIFALKEPETAAEGDVCVRIGDLSIISVNVGNNPSIELRPWLVTQYIGGEWTLKEAYVRDDSEWVALDGMIFYQGWLSPKWRLSAEPTPGYASASISNNGGVISMSTDATGISYAGSFVRTVGSFSFAGIKKINVLFSKSGNNAFEFQNGGQILYKQLDVGQNLTRSLDVSKIPMANNFGIGIQTAHDWYSGSGGSATIYKIWAE